MRGWMVVLALLAACGGRIESEAPSCPPADTCSRSGWGAHTRGAVACDDGTIAYVCCDYTQSELDELRSSGDVFAERCVVQQTTP